MEIIPDPIHVALLTLPFLVAAGALHFILWQPLLAYLEQRDQTASSARHETHELEAAAAEQMGQIEARLADARQRIAGVRQQARARALAAEAEIVAKARNEADQRVAEAVARIQTEKRAASSTLGSTATELSSDIAGRVLGRSVPPSAGAGVNA